MELNILYIDVLEAYNFMCTVPLEVKMLSVLLYCKHTVCQWTVNYQEAIVVLEVRQIYDMFED